MDLELDFLGQVAFVLVSENKIINSNYIVDLIVSTGIIFNMEKFDPKKNFKENNIDSLDLFTILLALEEELNIKFIRPKWQGKKPVFISSDIPTSTQITDTKKFGTICINETELKELDQNQKVPSQNLNLCFVGCVSTGKSMLLNALFCEQLSQCKIKRTTMVPAIFIENEKENENIISSEEIFKQIEEKNTEIIEKTESGIKMSSSVRTESSFIPSTHS